MKKYFVLAVVSIVSLVACVKQAVEQDVLELVSAETITVPAKGGNSVIELKSKSELKAVPADSWVKAEVLDHFTVKVTVDAYTGDEVRSTSVSITNAASSNPVRVKINQNAVTFTFTPEDHEFEAEGGEYSYEYTSEAPLEVSSDADWFTTEVGEKELVIKADANEAIKARSAEVKWNIGKNKGTFNISQKGAEPTLESEFFKDGKFDDIAAPIAGVSLAYPYTTNSELEVNSDDAWIEVYTEDDVFYINVDSNDGDAREGYIYWEVKGSKTLKGNFKVSQKGNFCDIKLQPGAYSGDPTSDPTNTMVLVASGTGVKAIKYYLVETSETEGKSDEELHAFVKTNGKAFSSSWIDYVNDNGLNLSLTGCDPETSYTLLAYATNNDNDEAYFIRRSSTLGDYIYDDYTKDDEYMLIPSKQYLYGEYIFLAKTTEDFTVPFSEREVQGNVTFTDGETSVDEDGFEYDWVNVNGMWNTVFNSRYGLTNDITQFDLYEGFLFMQDSDDLGDLVEKATGDVMIPAFSSMTRFEGSGYVWSLYGHIAGGIIDDNGTIAFFDTETYADQVDSAGDTFGAYSASLLWAEDMGWFAAFRDFLFIPVEKYATVNVASVRAKAARIQKEIKSMRRNYVEFRDSRVERAISKVRAAEKRELKAVANR